MGAGAGIGGTVGKKFAQEGYHAVLCRRSDEEGLQKLVSDIEAAGGEASGFLLNAVSKKRLAQSKWCCSTWALKSAIALWKR
jgi:NAD(P)-dependent dehydrogenase (short-subunit alcohol dehydrogenase family)